MKTLLSAVLVALFLAGCGTDPSGGTGGGSAGAGGATGGGSGGGAAGGTGGGSTGGGTGGGATGGGAGGGATGGGAGGGSAGGVGGGAGVGGGGGGGTTDSGTTDGGSGDAGCAGYKYCEDFEAYSTTITNNMTLGPWKASVGGTATTMAVDSIKPRHGARSLHITAIPDGGAAHGTLNQAAIAGLIPGNDLFGRAEVFYSDVGDAGLPIAVHSWVFSASGITPDGGSANMNMGGGGAMLQLNYHPPLPALEQSMKSGTITAGAWHCLQWEYNGSGTPPKNVAHVWIDGVDAVDVLATKGWIFPTPWNSFDFGFTHYQELINPIDIYLDDFALNDTMIPCPP